MGWMEAIKEAIGGNQDKPPTDLFDRAVWDSKGGKEVTKLLEVKKAGGQTAFEDIVVAKNGQPVPEGMKLWKDSLQDVATEKATRQAKEAARIKAAAQAKAAKEAAAAETEKGETAVAQAETWGEAVYTKPASGNSGGHRAALNSLGGGRGRRK